LQNSGATNEAHHSFPVAPSGDTQQNHSIGAFYNGGTSAGMSQSYSYPQGSLFYPPHWAQRILFPSMADTSQNGERVSGMYPFNMGPHGLQLPVFAHSMQIDAPNLANAPNLATVMHSGVERVQPVTVPHNELHGTSSSHHIVVPVYSNATPPSVAVVSDGGHSVSAAFSPSVPLAAFNNTYLNPRGTNGKFVSPNIGNLVANGGASSSDVQVTPKRTVVGEATGDNVAGAAARLARRQLQRRELAEYFHGRRFLNNKRGLVRTDANGEPLSLKKVLNSAIRDIAGRVLDVSVIQFSEHPAMCFELINHDIHRQFEFDPPLRENYVKEFLQTSLSAARCQWRKHWKKTGQRHENCPERRFPALVAYWRTPAAEEESRRMTRARKLRRQVNRPTVAEGPDGSTTSAQVICGCKLRSLTFIYFTCKINKSFHLCCQSYCLLCK
jgi:hypothetical protein